MMEYPIIELEWNPGYRIIPTRFPSVYLYDRVSNQEDFDNCPESYSDIGHPIKIDHLLIEQTLKSHYQKLSEKILTRNEGRNPQAHYGTYLGILQKK